MSEAVTGHDQSHGHDHHHDPNLQHHFSSMEQQMDASKIGMWLFLATEILLFGGLFCAYAIYRAHHPEIFIYAHQFLDVKMGAINTIVLIFSSFTAAWAVRLAQIGNKTGLIICLIITILCGGIFMGIKYVEYKHKWEHGLLWGTHYQDQLAHAQHGDSHETDSAHTDDTHAETVTASASNEEHAAEVTLAANEMAVDENKDISKIPVAAVPPAGISGEDAHSHGKHHVYTYEPKNVHKFFGIYFCMTGLHGLHVLIGMGVLTWVLMLALRDRISPGYYTPVDLAALYWHLVDLIWIYLFPLLYLIG